jgi:hypothetical protein
LKIFPVHLSEHITNNHKKATEWKYNASGQNSLTPEKDTENWLVFLLRIPKVLYSNLSHEAENTGGPCGLPENYGRSQNGSRLLPPPSLIAQ